MSQFDEYIIRVFPYFEDVQVDFALSVVSVLVISISTTILAFSDNVKEKSYQKKYIFVMYISVYFQFFIMKMSLFPVLVTYIVISIIATLNLIYSSETDLLEMELNKFQLITYQFFRWFFITKSYGFIAYIIASYFFKRLEKVVNINDYFFIFVSAIWGLSHLIGTAVDTFDMKHFSKSKEIIVKNANELFEIETDNYTKVMMLSFLVSVEDQDFVVRESPTISLALIIRRKLRAYKEQHRKPTQDKSNESFWNVFRIKIGLVRKINMKLWKIIKNYDKYLRGYSTIQGQFIRSHCMNDNSYRYKIRRKLFTEWIYTPYFYVAWIRWMRRVRFWESTDITYIEYAKILTLLAYYNSPIILKGEFDENKVFMNYQSRHDFSYYKIKYSKFEEMDKPSDVAILDCINNWYKAAEEIYSFRIMKYKRNVKIEGD